MSSVLSFFAYRLGLARILYWYKGCMIKCRGGGSISSSGLTDAIVWTCDELCQGGGLCDRIHGIVSSYYVAKKLGRDFKINFNYPVRLQGYLIPNQVNWSLPAGEDLRPINLIRQIPMMMGRFHATWEEERTYHERYLLHLCRRKGIKLIYTNARLVTGKTFSSLFNELFQPTATLSAHIVQHVRKLDGSYIGASFRFRNSLGDFYEPDSLPLSVAEQKNLIRENIGQIEVLHSRYPDQRLFIASDSNLFLQSLSGIDYVYFIPAKRSHLSYGLSDAIEPSFVDLFLLSKSTHIFLFHTEGMYRSGFAETASFIGNVPYEEVNF